MTCSLLELLSRLGFTIVVASRDTIAKFFASIQTKGAIDAAFVVDGVSWHELAATEAVVGDDLNLNRVFVQVIDLHHNEVVIGEQLGDGLLLRRWQLIASLARPVAWALLPSALLVS